MLDERNARRRIETSTALLDHLICAREHCGRNGEAERLGSSQVDDKLDLRDLLDRQITYQFWCATVRVLLRRNSSTAISATVSLRTDPSCGFGCPLESQPCS